MPTFPAKSNAQSASQPDSQPKKDKKKLLEERRARRAVSVDAKRKIADEHKDKGNVHFRNGEYDAAVKCYEDAISAYGPKAVYMSNLAAALLKLERYEEATNAAHLALLRDPKSIKARFRRGLARKGVKSLKGAFLDFSTVLRMDPTCNEAREELTALTRARQNQFDAAMDDLNDEFEDQEVPRPEDEPEDRSTPVPSDSEDYQHSGNGIPCRFYNHDGCNRGNDCKFSHAPDNRSIRDDLGRNVCLYYVAGLCKFDDERCVYAHDKTYVDGKRFHDPKRLNNMREMLENCGAAHSAQALEKVAPSIHNPIKSSDWLPRRQLRIADITTGMALQYAVLQGDVSLRDIPPALWPITFGIPETYDSEEDESEPKQDSTGKRPARATTSAAAATTTAGAPGGKPGDGSKRRSANRPVGKGRGKRKTPQRKTQGTTSYGHRDYAFNFDNDSEAEMEERMANLGFTNAEVEELLCQGVKPWDDDAWDVLHALNSL